MYLRLQGCAGHAQVCSLVVFSCCYSKDCIFPTTANFIRLDAAKIGVEITTGIYSSKVKGAYNLQIRIAVFWKLGFRNLLHFLELVILR